MSTMDDLVRAIDNVNKTMTRGVNNLEMLVTIGIMDGGGDNAIADVEEETRDITTNSLKVRSIMRELRGAERRKRVGE